MIWMPGWLRQLGLGALCASLGGVALGQTPPGTRQPDAQLASLEVDAASDEGSDVTSPDGTVKSVLAWRLNVDAPEPLDTLLETYLDLARFERELAKDASLQISRNELRRLVVSAPEQARALLDAQGYFNARISTSVRDAKGGEPILITLHVTPGERTKVSKVQFVYEGDLDTRASDGDARAQALITAVDKAWSLPVGEFFTQDGWSGARNAALARLRAQGYPMASWSGTSATVDAAQQTAKLFLVADSGPTFRFGDIRVEGLKRQPASAVTHLAPFNKGDPYQEKQLLDWQERIQKLNLFDNIFVSTDLDPTQADASPVVVQLRELPMQAATTGIGVSSDTGPRVSAEYLHRNVFDLGWQAKSTIQLGRLDSHGQVDFTSHPWEGGKRGLVSGQASYLLDSDKAATTSQRLRVGQLREGERLERTDYIEYQRAQVQSAANVLVSDARSVSYTTQFIFRNVDNQVLPTRGTTTLAQLSGGRSYSASSETGYFGRSYARVTCYQPWPWNWHMSARAELGQVFAADTVTVPDTLLFRAGGDESVRGYAYRSLGVIKDGVVTGGRSLATASLELGHPLLQRMPSLWGAVFVDAGDAADRFGQLQANVGYGAGIRWRSPVGPLRLDMAYGTKVQDWRIHFSVGVSL